MTRDGRSGVSLLNVLAVLALGTSLVTVMLHDQDLALEQLEQSSNAAQARSLAQGGIASTVVALRRDLAQAPDVDHLGEAWAQAAQQQITLEFGQFEVSIEDARGKFDLNALQPAALAELRVFGALLTALDLPTALASQVTQIITRHGPLPNPRALLDYGIGQRDIDRLEPHVTATGTRGTLNLNSVTEPLMIALVRNPSAARVLLARRSANGFLSASDFAALGVPQPPLAGYTSDIFDVRAAASVGDARVRIARRLVRDADTATVVDQTLP